MVQGIPGTLSALFPFLSHNIFQERNNQQNNPRPLHSQKLQYNILTFKKIEKVNLELTTVRKKRDRQRQQFNTLQEENKQLTYQRNNEHKRNQLNYNYKIQKNPYVRNKLKYNESMEE